MPTIFTHPALPVALGMGLGQRTIPKRLRWAGIFASILPDFDIIAFPLGIPYAAALGHRGFSHSILFALLVGLVAALAHQRLHSGFKRCFWFCFLCCLSHPLLDALTNGGLGVGLLLPWSAERYFAPVQMIEVAPLKLTELFSMHGLRLALSELLWVWLPFLIIGKVLAWFRRAKALPEETQLLGAMDSRKP